MTTYLVTGASGQLGQLVTGHLKTLAPASDIVALVRSDKAKAAYAAKGIEARIGDYEDPEGLRTALTGIDRLLLISASEVGKRTGQHGNVIAAAKAAGVGFIAYTSILNADTGGMKLAEEHIATEAAIRESGLAYTLLRNGWYSENIAGAAPQALSMGKHFGAAGDGRFATASRKDYAEGAAVVLAGSGHEGKTYELGGDESYTLAEYAALLSSISGTQVAYVDLPEVAYKDALIEAGVPAPMAAILADSDAKAGKGALMTKSRDLSHLIGRPTTPVNETIKTAIA
jgi:NAD(P)H dehydrogenase (quinone)